MGKWGQFWRRKKSSRQEDAAQSPETQARPALGELGRLLRETREEKEIALEDIETQTRIRQKYILALEEGRYDELPTPGHIHGFLRNYAICLGLDMAEVEALYARDRAAHRRFEPNVFHPKSIALIPKKPLIKADLVLSVVIVLVLVVAGWFVYQQYGLPMSWFQPTPVPTAATTPTPEETVGSKSTGATATRQAASPTSTPASATATPTEEPTPEPTATQTAMPTLDSPLTIATPTPEPTAAQTFTPAPTRVEGVMLQIKVIDRVWLQVTVDGRELPGELLEVDEEREWQGQYSIYMICGNAGGVQITVNGEDLGVLGARAEVVERMWGPEGEITPTPTVAEGTPTPTTAP
jgi:cytoskeletal protein RodZ